jgi:hypothetical protein
MREIRQSGSEGGGAESNHLSLPLYSLTPLRGWECWVSNKKSGQQL